MIFPKAFTTHFRIYSACNPRADRTQPELPSPSFSERNQCRPDGNHPQGDCQVNNSKFLALAAACVRLVSLRYPHLEGFSAALALLAATAAFTE
jgi:hypothetical protein